MRNKCVHIRDGRLFDHFGHVLRLEGVGLNGWLLPEGYMFNSFKGIDRPRRFYAWTESLIGKGESDRFWEAFRRRFITEKDIEAIKEMGFNSVRLPFDYGVVFEPSEEKVRLSVRKEGLDLIDRLIGWCKKHQLYVILDLHGAPGGQTGANIDNSRHDQPELFTNRLYREQTVYIWRYLADRYKDEPWVAAYDLLNEPLPEWFKQYNHELVPLYREIIEAIRSVDPDHLISLEGVHWATDVSVFDRPLDQKVLLQFHKYWSPFDLKAVKPYLDLARRWHVPLYMGEGGEHHLLWYSGAFKLYRQLDMSWCFWSYKKIENSNSICSFQEPELWQRLLSCDPDLTQKEMLDTLDAFLNSITYESCSINQNVVNHLFQQGTFETFGIAFDFDPSLRFKEQTDFDARFRSSEQVVCVDESGEIMIPDFSIGKKPGINTPFPYLKVNTDRDYSYLFHVAHENGDTRISIFHRGMTEFTITIDDLEIVDYDCPNDVIEISLRLTKGPHHLIVRSKRDAAIKKIAFQQL